MPERPDDRVLQRLLLGRLPPHEADQLCLALADDSRLTAAGRQPPSEDSLLTLLRSHKGRAKEASPPRLERLADSVVRRLAALGDATPQAPPLPPGSELSTVPGTPRHLGAFTLLGVLGVGGMGVVYHAHDEQLNRRVALKVIRAELAARPEVRERFLREARHAATVEHANVVTIHQVGEVEGVPFLTMPVLQGETLEARLTRTGTGQPLPLTEVFRIGREVAEGLAAAHERGLVHRDIKPSNLWLQASEETETFRVVILDFGLARLQTQQSTFTESGVLLGTPAYMAPEQARGRAVDHRADLFSLGCVLYQMATGRRPFAGADPLAVLASLALDHPEPPARLNRAVPPALSELILRLLEKNPTRRPDSARAVAQQLAAIERRPLSRPRRPTRRLLVGALLGIVCLAAALPWLLPSLRPQTSASAVPVDPERAAAEWAVRVGGRAEFVQGTRLLHVGPGEPFPKEPLPVFAIHLDHVAAVTDADLARFAGLPDLSYLTLSDTSVGDAGLVHLVNVPKLRGVYLNRTRVSDEGLRHLARLPALAELTLIDTANPVTDAGLAHLANIPELQDLGVGSERLTGDCTRHLRRCRGIQTLMLRAPLNTREQLADLASLPRLRRLELTSAELPSAALPGLTAAAQLEHLRLDAAGLTDEAVPALSRLTGLRSLQLPRSRLSPTAVRALREGLPGCEIGFE